MMSSEMDNVDLKCMTQPRVKKLNGFIGYAPISKSAILYPSWAGQFHILRILCGHERIVATVAPNKNRKHTLHECWIILISTRIYCDTSIKFQYTKSTMQHHALWNPKKAKLVHKMFFLHFFGVDFGDSP